MDEKQLMEKIKEVLVDEVPRISYATYIKPLDIESIDGNHITFKCESHYVKDPV